MMIKTKIKSNYFLLLFVVVAFLATQWTSTHIHLAAQHHHDDSHHQHALKTHAHNTPFFSDQHPNLHADTIDVSHGFSAQQAHANTVDLDFDTPLKKKSKQQTALDALTHSNASPPSSRLQASSIQITPIVAKRQYLDHSIIHPRAPPLQA